VTYPTHIPKVGQPTDLLRLPATNVAPTCYTSVVTNNETVVAALTAHPDPVVRAQQALVEIENARTLMEELALERAKAVYELYKQHGASKAARLLGINRVNLYRVIRELPEVKAQQNGVALQATLVTLQLLTSLNGAGGGEIDAAS
jgi:ribosomal protein S12 methylthiotransferase accessory factor YcaO